MRAVPAVLQHTIAHDSREVRACSLAHSKHASGWLRVAGVAQRCTGQGSGIGSMRGRHRTLQLSRRRTAQLSSDCADAQTNGVKRDVETHHGEGVSGGWTAPG